MSYDARIAEYDRKQEEKNIPRVEQQLPNGALRSLESVIRIHASTFMERKQVLLNNIPDNTDTKIKAGLEAFIETGEKLDIDSLLLEEMRNKHLTEFLESTTLFQKKSDECYRLWTHIKDNIRIMDAVIRFYNLPSGSGNGQGSTARQNRMFNEYETMQPIATLTEGYPDKLMTEYNAIGELLNDMPASIEDFYNDRHPKTLSADEMLANRNKLKLHSI